MATYNVNIKYGSDDKKSGKIIITNKESNKVILDSHIVLPNAIHETKRFQVKEVSEIEFNFPEHFSFDLLRKKFGEKFIELKLQQGLTLILLQNKDFVNYKGELTGATYHASVSEKDFDLISKIINSDNKISFTGEKKLLMLGAKNTYSTKFLELNKIISNCQIGIKPRIPKINEDESAFPAQMPQTQSTLQIPKKENKDKEMIDYLLSDNLGYVNIDPFDAMLLKNAPNLLPIFKPNLAIGAFLFLQMAENRKNMESNSLVINDLQKVKGFEDVNGINIQKSENGSYVIDMFKDDEKCNPLFSLEFNENEKLKIKDNYGNKSIINEIEDKPGYMALTELNNGTSIFLETVENKNQFLGNWYVQNQDETKEMSSFIFDRNFELQSNQNNIYDLNALSYNKSDNYSESNNFLIAQQQTWSEPAAPQEDWRSSSSNSNNSPGW